jgi:hypothetical protein
MVATVNLLHKYYVKIWGLYGSSVVVKAAASRKVAGSSPDEVDLFNWPNPSGRIMALGSTQPLTEMSTRNL